MSSIDFKERLEIFKDITYRYNLIFPSDYLYIGQEKKWNLTQMIKLWRFYLRKETDPFLYLYFHLPFCYKQRCAYCENLTTVLRTEDQLAKYLDYLAKMMTFYHNFFGSIKTKAMYIGGGTPSILNAQQIEKFLQNINKNFSFSPDGLHTMEMSPVTASYEKIDVAKANGINRISMGVQTLNCNILDQITRLGNLPLSELKDLFSYVNKKKLDDFNIDLIIGLPNESVASFLDSLKEILKMDVPSVTVYKYIHNYEQEKDKNNAEYYWQQHLIIYPQMQKKVSELITSYGYEEETKRSGFMNLYRYVKKNHTKKRDYFPQWNPQDNNSILGIGRGAESFITNKVFAIEKFELFDAGLQPNGTEFSGFILNKDDQMRNYIIFEFWRHGQFSLIEFQRIFKEDFTGYFEDELTYLQSVDKISIINDIVEFKVRDVLDFAVYIKFFFNFNYLVTNYIAR